MVKAFLASHIEGKAKVTWKIAHLYNSHVSEVDRKRPFTSTHMVKQEEVDLKNETTALWEISPHSLQYGIYYIEVMVEIKNSSNCVNYNYGFLRIKESPLQAVISATPSEERILQGYHKELKLDASGSFDPDVQNADKSAFRYTWLCARKHEEFKNISLLPLVTPDDSVESSNGKGCYGTGPGRLNFTEPTAVLFLDKMEAEERYVIKLILEKDNRRSYVSHEFALKTKFGFGLEIR